MYKELYVPPKYFLFCLLCLAAQLHAHANAIDSIRTKEDVVRFISAHLDKKQFDLSGLFMPQQIVIDPDVTADKREQWLQAYYRDYRSNNFYKTDIDGNGKTDLIVNGGYSFIIMDKDTGFETYQVGIDIDSFVNTIQVPGGGKGLLYKCLKMVNAYWQRIDSTYFDTLVYRYNNFVEYHGHPASLAIKKVGLYDLTPVYGPRVYYPFFEIDKNGLAKLTRADGKHDTKDFLRANLDTLANDFWGLLTYMDPASMKNEYNNVAITDLSTSRLNIYFEDGSVKNIQDYAFFGTMGLRSLYNIIFKWEKSDIWHPLDTAHTDTLLVEDPTAFFYGKFFYSDFQEKRTDSSFTEYVKRIPSRDFTFRDDKYTLRLFPDHHFVYTYSLSPDIEFEADGLPDRLLSIGNWTQNGNIITLRWDGYKTLAATRDKKEWRKYFVGDAQPKPYRIKDQQFSSDVK